MAKAYKRVARYIHAHGLQPGDRLPPQDKMREIVGVSNKTLMSAMGLMVEDGLVTRRTSVGTIISSLEPLQRVNWSVGLATFAAPQSGQDAFFGDLSHRIHSKLFDAGCSVSTYFCDVTRRSIPRVTDFEGLSEDLEHNRLDGILTPLDWNLADWKDLKDRGIAICHVGIWRRLPCHTVVDHSFATREAVALLARRGCVSPALVNMLDSPDDFTGESFSCDFDDVALVRKLAHELLARDARKRPDALIVGDDYVALWLMSVLAKREDYRPEMVVVTNRQLPLVFPWAVERFELDADELADAGVAHMKKRLIEPGARESVELVKPRYIGQSEAWAASEADAAVV